MQSYVFLHWAASFLNSLQEKHIHDLDCNSVIGGVEDFINPWWSCKCISLSLSISVHQVQLAVEANDLHRSILKNTIRSRMWYQFAWAFLNSPLSNVNKRCHWVISWTFPASSKDASDSAAWTYVTINQRPLCISVTNKNYRNQCKVK